MFSSPSIRLYNSENGDNLVQRKPGNNLTTRKPFLDRSVNSKTPDAGKLLKPKKTFAKETGAVETPKISPKEDLNAEDFMFFFKDVKDTYGDIWPITRLGTEGLIKILHNYCSTEDTPPPSPEPAPVLHLAPIFFELPEIEMPKLLDEDVFEKNFEVELPELEYGNLDDIII